MIMMTIFSGLSCTSWARTSTVRSSSTSWRTSASATPTRAASSTRRTRRRQVQATQEMFYNSKKNLFGMLVLFVLCSMMGKDRQDDLFISYVNTIQIAKNKQIFPIFSKSWSWCLHSWPDSNCWSGGFCSCLTAVLTIYQFHFSREPLAAPQAELHS